MFAFINNPSIMQFYGSFADEQHVYLILEYVQGGTLQSCLTPPKKLPEYDVFVMMRQLSIAVKYLYDHGLSHKQLKPEHIMLNNKVAKLSGFDQAGKFKKGGHGTDNPGFDLWCMGMLLYQALTGKQPFDAKIKWQLLQETADPSKLSFPLDIPAQAKDLILSLLHRNPQNQIRPDKLLLHPYLNRPEKQPKHQ